LLADLSSRKEKGQSREEKKSRIRKHNGEEKKKSGAMKKKKTNKNDYAMKLCLCGEMRVCRDEDPVFRIEHVPYVGDRVTCQEGEKRDHFFEFDVQRVGEPRRDGDGVFGVPLVAEVIIVDDDGFPEISSEK